MDIMALIDRIEELVDGGRSLPFGSSKMVDPDKVYEIIDEIRAQFPDELKQARWIVKERQEMLEDERQHHFWTSLGQWALIIGLGLAL